MRTRGLAVLFLSLATTALRAQATITVGAGGQFTTLPAAVAAAQNGDLILVEPGAYDVGGAGLVINKGLRILGGPNTVIFGPYYSYSSQLKVTGLPADQTFVLDGFQIFGSGGTHAVYPLELVNNSGSVHLSNLEVTGTCQTTTTCDGELMISQCANVLMSWCRVSRLSVTSYWSDLTMVQCDVKGRTGHDPQSSYGMAPSHGLFVIGGTARVMQSQLRGGDGHRTYPGYQGVAMSSGEVTIVGDHGAVIGTGAPGTLSAMNSAIESYGGTVRLDPGVTIQPNVGAPAATTFLGGTVVPSRPVGLSAQGSSIGGTVTFYVRTDVGEWVGLFAGLASSASVPTPYGPVWLDMGTLLDLGSAIQDASQAISMNVPVPNDPALRGRIYNIVALAGGAAHPWRISNHTTVMLR